MKGKMFLSVTRQMQGGGEGQQVTILRKLEENVTQSMSCVRCSAGQQS